MFLFLKRFSVTELISVIISWLKKLGCVEKRKNYLRGKITVGCVFMGNMWDFRACSEHSYEMVTRTVTPIILLDHS